MNQLKKQRFYTASGFVTTWTATIDNDRAEFYTEADALDYISKKGKAQRKLMVIHGQRI